MKSSRSNDSGGEIREDRRRSEKQRLACLQGMKLMALYTRCVVEGVGEVRNPHLILNPNLTSRKQLVNELEWVSTVILVQTGSSPSVSS